MADAISLSRKIKKQRGKEKKKQKLKRERRQTKNIVKVTKGLIHKRLVVYYRVIESLYF